jgi:hypothetical protein
LQYLVVPEPQDTESRFAQPLVANAIGFAVQVLTTINFDDQAPFETDKVKNVALERVLPAKFDASDLTPTQTLSQASFGVSSIGSQVATKFAVVGR